MCHAPTEWWRESSSRKFSNRTPPLRMHAPGPSTALKVGIAGVEEIDHALSAAVAPLAAADTPEPVSFESEDADGPAGVLALAIYASRLDC